MKGSLSALAVASVLTGVALAQAPGTPVRITGRVVRVDDNGSLANARVTVTMDGQAAERRVAMTDGDGRFTITVPTVRTQLRVHS